MEVLYRLRREIYLFLIQEKPLFASALEKAQKTGIIFLTNEQIRNISSFKKVYSTKSLIKNITIYK